MGFRSRRPGESRRPILIFTFSFAVFVRVIPSTSSSRRRPGSSSLSSSPRRRGPSALALACRCLRDNRLTSLCFRRASLRAGHFSLLAQREVTKRKGTRVTRPLSRVRCGRPGSADGTSMARSGIGAIPRADPSGLFVRPPPRHTGFKVKGRAKLAALDSSGPLGRGECAEEKARRGARRKRARSLSARDGRQRTSGAHSRSRRLLRRPRPRGCPSLWLLSLGQARESDSLAMDGE